MSAVAGASQEPIASPAASRKASTTGTAPPDKGRRGFLCLPCSRARRIVRAGHDPGAEAHEEGVAA